MKSLILGGVLTCLAGCPAFATTYTYTAQLSSVDIFLGIPTEFPAAFIQAFTICAQVITVTAHS